MNLEEIENCFVLSARLGDCILGSIVFNKLVQQTNQPWAWATRVPYLPIVKEFTPMGVELLDDFAESSGAAKVLLKARFANVVCTTPMWYWDEWAKGDVYLVDLVARKAQVELKPEDRVIVLNPTSSDCQVVSELLGDIQEYVVVSGSPHYSGVGIKDWPMHVRIDLVERLCKQGLTVVVVGGSDAYNMGGLFLGGRTTYLQTVEVIKRAKLYIGNCCGTSWLACAARSTPKIIASNFAPKPGKEGYAGCLFDNNIVDVDWRDSSDKILNIAKEHEWL